MSTIAAPSVGETAVRRYLTFLNDRASLVDHTQIEALRARLAAEPDPIERLRISSELDRSMLLDEKSYEEEFVSVARRFAAEADITVDAYRRMKVPERLLVRAGLVKSGKRRIRQHTADEIEAVAAKFPGEWNYSTLYESTGASKSSVRRVINRMLADGKTVKVSGTSDGWYGAAYQNV